MGTSVRVLVVDEETDVLNLTSDFLEQVAPSFDVVTATSAEGALDELDASVDAVVSDYQMPEMDGLALASAVRDRQPGLPFVLFTGKKESDVANEVDGVGLTAHVEKRTGTEQYTELAAAIRDAVPSEATHG